MKGATTLLAGRIAKSFGKPFSGTNDLTHIFPTPEALADAKLEKIGLTGKRLRRIRALARAVSDGKIIVERIGNSDAFLSELCEIPGIGHWTAQYVAMRAFVGRPDAFPPAIWDFFARSA